MTTEIKLQNTDINPVVEESLGKVYEMTSHNKSEFKHPKFEHVLSMVQANIPVLLWGEAGTGKNVMCEQVTAALGLSTFGFTNSVLETYQLQGFVDASGNPVKTAFYECWTKGGVFMLDEMDNSSPEALIWLNAAIANRMAVFPWHETPIEAHKDFRFVAGANSNGFTHDPKYKRRTLDAATLNRFAMIHIEWSEELEKLIFNKAVSETTDSIKQIQMTKIYESFKKIRELAEEYQDNFIISTRKLSDMLKYIKEDKIGLTDNEILEYFIFQGDKSVSKYQKELRTLSLNIRSVGTGLSAEHTTWTVEENLAEDIVREFNDAEADSDTTLATLISRTYSDINTDDADLLNIKLSELKKTIAGVSEVTWNKNTNATFNSSMIIISEVKGKLVARMTSGNTVLKGIENDTYTVVSWDADKYQGIVITSNQGSTEDHSIINSIKIKAG